LYIRHCDVSGAESGMDVNRTGGWWRGDADSA
jgi:hypothetical protein